MMVTATYSGEQIEVTFSAETDRSDYGVSGSPVWDEVDQSTIAVEALTICGADVDIEDLPMNLQKAIMELADEIEFV